MIVPALAAAVTLAPVAGLLSLVSGIGPGKYRYSPSFLDQVLGTAYTDTSDRSIGCALAKDTNKSVAA